MNTFIPFDELVKFMEFTDLPDEECRVCSVGGHVIGSVTYESLATEGTIDLFKMVCLKEVAAMSSTVILITACGCTQETNLPEFRKELHIPITRNEIMLLRDARSIADAVNKNDKRIFRFDSEKDDAGFKVYREVI